MSKLQIKIPKGQFSLTLLTVGALVSVALVLIRWQRSDSTLYFSFCWNLFLAWIPLFFSTLLVHLDEIGAATWKKVLAFCCWFAFFPNAPYMITDLFHLQQTPDAPLWFDLILIISFAWNALMVGHHSLFEVHRFLGRKIGQQKAWLAVAFILLISAYGVYLGRFERWNSWDVLAQPLPLLQSIAATFLHPWAHREVIAITFFFSVFLFIAYLSFIPQRYGKS